MISIFIVDALLVLLVSGVMNVFEILHNKKIERIDLEARYEED